MNENKYARKIKSIDGKTECEIDVYSILDAFKTGSSAIDHAIKKLLCAGKRGVKDKNQDLKEAIKSIERAIDE